MEISPSLPCKDQQNHPAFLCSLDFFFLNQLKNEWGEKTLLEYAFPLGSNVFVCGFPKLNLDSGKEGLGCENAISHDSGLLIYRGTNDFLHGSLTK